MILEPNPGKPMTHSVAHIKQETPGRATIATSSIFFWAVAIFMLFWSLGDRALWTAEDRWAEISRNMVLSHDYFHPRINGELYFDKPLGGYWAIALASHLTGSVNELAIRIPSALAGLITLWMTIHLGRKLWSVEAGRIAGWLLLSSYGFIFWARTGQSDMENTAFIMMAIVWYWTRRDRSGFTTSAVFYTICAIGAHMKGLTAIAVPCAAVFPDLLRDRRWKHFLTPSHYAALAVGLLVYFAIFLGQEHGGLHLAFRENVERYFSPFDHIEPFYVYLYHLPILFLPWAPLLLVALGAAIARGKGLLKLDYPTQWAMQASVLMFLFYTCSGSRRNYYILPLVPFCSLLCARFLVSASYAKLRQITLSAYIGFFLVLGVGGLLVSGILPLVKSRLPISLPSGFSAGLAMFSLLSLVPFVLRKWRPAVPAQLTGVGGERAVLLLSVVILMCSYICVQYSQLDSLRTTRAFVRSAAVKDLDSKGIAFYHTTPMAVATVVYYLNDPIPHQVLQTPSDVIHFLSERPGDNSLMITREGLALLTKDLPSDFSFVEAAAEPSMPLEPRTEKAKKWLILQLHSPGT